MRQTRIYPSASLFPAVGIRTLQRLFLGDRGVEDRNFFMPWAPQGGRGSSLRRPKKQPVGCKKYAGKLTDPSHRVFFGTEKLTDPSHRVFFWVEKNSGGRRPGYDCAGTPSQGWEGAIKKDPGRGCALGPTWSPLRFHKPTLQIRIQYTMQSS